MSLVANVHVSFIKYHFAGVATESYDSAAAHIVKKKDIILQDCQHDVRSMGAGSNVTGVREAEGC